MVCVDNAHNLKGIVALAIPLYIRVLVLYLSFQVDKFKQTSDVNNPIPIICRWIRILTMDNTKNILLMAAIASLLIIGTSMIPMQSYAALDDDENKKYNDNNSKTSAISQTHIKSSIQPSTPGPTPTTLNICKKVINTGTIFSFEPSDFTFAFNTPASPVLFQGANEGCTAVTVAPGTYEFSERRPIFAENNSVGVIGDCTVRGSSADTVSFTGTIAAGETQTCTITNTLG